MKLNIAKDVALQCLKDILSPKVLEQAQKQDSSHHFGVNCSDYDVIKISRGSADPLKTTTPVPITIIKEVPVEIIKYINNTITEYVYVNSTCDSDDNSNNGYGTYNVLLGLTGTVLIASLVYNAYTLYNKYLNSNQVKDNDVEMQKQEGSLLLSILSNSSTAPSTCMVENGEFVEYNNGQRSVIGQNQIKNILKNVGSDSEVHVAIHFAKYAVAHLNGNTTLVDENSTGHNIDEVLSQTCNLRRAQLYVLDRGSNNTSWGSEFDSSDTNSKATGGYDSQPPEHIDAELTTQPLGDAADTQETDL